jgi:tRNA pseudouridine38-40 synthase
MRTIKLTLAYDGTAYAGWQLQAVGKSVQEVLETAIEKATGRKARVVGSGRTDAGVHALGQVAAFHTESRMPVDVLRRALNAHLPRDVAILEAADAEEGFHPIRDARRKRYRYTICDGPVRDVFRRGTAWFCRSNLDAEAMHRAGQVLVGTHDFQSFQTQGSSRRSTVRTVMDLQVRREWAESARKGDRHLADSEPVPFSVRRLAGTIPGMVAEPVPFSIDRHLRDSEPVPFSAERHVITIEIEADGFLYNMVRCIVGTLVQVGRGNRPESWVAEVLAARDRSAAGPTAPARGLCLLWVEHEEGMKEEG